MKLFIWGLILTTSLWAQVLTFEKNHKLVRAFTLKELKSGQLKFKDVIVGSVDRNAWNPWRDNERTYRGYDLVELFNAVFGPEWKKDGLITFEATDGYRQSVNVQELFARMDDDFHGLIAYTESGKEGFSLFYKGEQKKLVNPGPFYLIWSGYNYGSKTTHEDKLKWPYQMKKISFQSTP